MYDKPVGGDDDVGPIYVLPLQRGHGIGSFLSGLFRAVRPVLWSGAKDFGKATLKALGKLALRTGGKILMGIADNPTVSAHDIISKNLTESLQNLTGNMMRGQGRKRKRGTSRKWRQFKRVKRSSLTSKLKRKPRKKASKTIKETSSLKVNQ